MDTSRSEGKRTLRRYTEESEEEEEEDENVTDDVEFEEEEERRKKRMMTDLCNSKKGNKGGSSSVAPPPPCCQVDNCDADLSDAKQYHRRHKVCEYHAKAPAVHISGSQQRFCQQCSRFHELSNFDDSKRSCRRRLAGHNERRRKTAADYHGE